MEPKYRLVGIVFIEGEAIASQIEISKEKIGGEPKEIHKALTKLLTVENSKKRGWSSLDCVILFEITPLDNFGATKSDVVYPILNF